MSLKEKIETNYNKSLKSKDGKSEYILEQDVSTGDTIIKKINKEGDDMITDVEIMELKKGEDVITKMVKRLNLQMYMKKLQKLILEYIKMYIMTLIIQMELKLMKL